MKHLCRRSESQFFTGAVIHSAFDHLQILVRHFCHLAHLGHVLPQQAIEVLVGASPPAGKGLGKVARAAQRFINPGVPAKFFAVVIGQGLDPSLQRIERFDDGRANQISCFV